MGEIKSFRDLIAWQKAIEMVDTAYKLTREFPREELFGLRSQMRRSAVSVPSNIAEGYGRRRLAEYLRFLDIARGSLCELQTQCIISHRQGFLDCREVELLEDIMDQVGKLLYRLTESLNKKSPR